MSPRTVLDRIRVNHRLVRRGTELSIKRERGRFRFLEYVSTGAGHQWINVYGPIDSEHAKLRSFDPARIKTVHRTAKGRE